MLANRFNPIDLCVNSNFKFEPLYTIDEYIDSLAKMVGGTIWFE